MTSLQRPMMISKIHRATVTQADLHYVGSLTIDMDLMEAADLLPGQQVDVVDVETHELADPDARGVEQLQSGPVPQVLRRAALDAVDQARRLVRAQDVRQRQVGADRDDGVEQGALPLLGADQLVAA